MNPGRPEKLRDGFAGQLNAFTRSVVNSFPNQPMERESRMISMKAIREEFGGVTRLSPTVCKSEIETKKETTHYYFRSVRGKHSDLLTTSNHADDEFAVALLEQAVERLAEGRLLAPLDPANPFQFDAMLLLSPEYHGHLRGTLDDARRNLVLCVPIHRCEFTADVTPSEYRQ